MSNPAKDRVQGMLGSAERWGKVSPKAVVAGSTAQAENVLTDAIHDIGCLWETCREAADEIERLTRELAEAREALEEAAEDIRKLATAMGRVAEHPARIMSAIEPAGVGVETPPPQTHVAPIGWATVRVEDTCDGLLINAEDMKRFGLQYDVHYEGHFLPDGRYRIAILSPSPQPMAAVTKEATHD